MKSICLLANDNPFLLEGYKLGLSPHFDEMVTAQNGQEAVDLVTSHPRTHFSAIVLDIEMPVMNGMEACLRIDKYLREEQKVAQGSIAGFSKHQYGDMMIKSSELGSNLHQY